MKRTITIKPDGTVVIEEEGEVLAPCPIVVPMPATTAPAPIYIPWPVPDTTPRWTPYEIIYTGDGTPS